MGNNRDNLFIGAPAIAGVLYSAPAGTPIPTSTPLPEEFAFLGAISEDGITRKFDRKTKSILDMGNVKMRNIITESGATYELSFLEALNLNTLRELHGAEYVVESEDKLTITVSHNLTHENPTKVYVIVLQDGATGKLEIVKAGQVAATGEVVYKAGEEVIFGVTIDVLGANDGTGIDIVEIISLGTAPQATV